MAILDDLTKAASDAISTGAKAARGQGTALKGDFEKLLKPNFEAILVQIAAITEDAIAKNIGPAQAKSDLATQLDRVQPLVLAIAELSLLAVQVIIDAILDALKAVVNTATTHAIGIALL
jgi:hypothetical protein